ncbi:MAG: dipeptidase [Phycisphaerae bacterium]|nr:dipeptidase [Phycisphaerae bacterium]
MESALSFLKEHRQEHLDWAIDFCKIPSVSTLAERKGDVAAAAKWLKDLCVKIGLKAEIHETGGHPVVYAEHITNRALPTYLVYGHYDVQPTGDLSLWESGPFEPVVKDEWLLARGSADDKGQLLVHLRAVAAYLGTDQPLPINLKFLIEGEEEISSPNLLPFLKKHRDLLKCNHVLISDTGMFADGWPTITYGTRGILYKEIRLNGPKFDLHSGSFGGTVANPANELTEIIAALHDDDGWVTIPGFYSKVDEVSSGERAQLAALPFDKQQYLEDTGSPDLAGEAGYTTNERRWIRPTLDVNGIYGGFMAEGANTIIPARAGAKISMRLVPHQSADELSEAFDQTIRSLCPHTLRLEIINHGRADAYSVPIDSPPIQAARRALREAFDQDTALIREGGSLPILSTFKKLLGVDSLLIGFASPTCNAHGPNEKVRIPDLDNGAAAIVRLLKYLGETR